MTSRNLYFLFPEMNIHSGGHIAQLKFMAIAQSLFNVQPVTYKKQEKDILFLDEIIRDIKDISAANNIYIIHWGPHIQELLTKLKNQNVVYFAHSTGYKVKIPSKVPIISVSKHSQAYWGRYAPNNLIFYLPNEISDKYHNQKQERKIDVLVQKRKSSKYLIEELVPALNPHCNLTLIDYWVEDLATIFNQTKVYLYDSTEYWVQAKASEGFGLPPLEAMACGCTIFSSINDALSDYLDPSFNCYKLRVYSKEYDVQRILSAVENWQENDNIDTVNNYRLSLIKERIVRIFEEINNFFDHQQSFYENIPPIIKNKPFSFDKIIKKISSFF
ncbi:glycosyltransferase [Geminocystis sp. GBBB08]|uniref:glycosyltransferase n=1 Tax=Geminocystis sp. GBBB08 TaxID=2604140 RepID=UPI0027E2CFC1|nr:glycosyltransferase [Geminocystis sp. GBBB08]